MQASAQCLRLFWRKNVRRTLFSLTKVSSWSARLVCRQSAMRESHDLNNKGNPRGWPWLIQDRQLRVNKREILLWLSRRNIDPLPGRWPDWSNARYVFHKNISQNLGIYSVFRVNGSTKSTKNIPQRQTWLAGTNGGGVIWRNPNWFLNVVGSMLEGGGWLSRALADNTCAYHQWLLHHCISVKLTQMPGIL